MEKTEVQRRFTTTIPKAVREKLGLKEGTGLFWSVEDGRIVVYRSSPPQGPRRDPEDFPAQPEGPFGNLGSGASAPAIGALFRPT